MSIQSGRAKLSDAFKRLDTHWRQTREHWQDAIADQFEHERIEPLVDNTRTALTAVARLQETLHKARRDCEVDR